MQELGVLLGRGGLQGSGRGPAGHLGCDIFEPSIGRQHDRGADRDRRRRQISPPVHGRLPGRVEGVHGTDQHRHLRLGSNRRDLCSLLRGGRERLLTQHGPLARPAGRDHLACVQMVRAADGHDLDGLVGQQLLQRRRRRRPDPGGDGRRHVGGHVEDLPDLEVGGQPSQGRQVDGLRDRTAADEPDA